MLGLYLIEKAEKKGKEINQTTLFQKAQIKKTNLKRIEDNSLRLKNHFLESYNQILNTSLSNTLTKVKEDVLNLKNSLLKEIKIELKNQIQSKISEKYPIYINFLIASIKKVITIIDKPPNVLIVFNSKDFAYFKTNFNQIQSVFKNKVEIINSEYEFIGGFKVILENVNISYEYTIDNLLIKNSSLIEKEFSIIFSESEIKKLQFNFENFIQNKRLDIKEYFNYYD